METPFLQVPKRLFEPPYRTALSNNAILLYAFLVDRQKLSIKNGWYEDGEPFVFLTAEDAMKSICCSKPTALTLFRELEAARLIRRKKQGNRACKIFVREGI